MPSEKITFPGHDGHDLAARLDRPSGPHLATALFAHCFTCSKDIPAARRIAQRLNAAGIAVLRFDFTGLGHSEGEFANTSFATNLADLKAAATWLADNDMAPDLLVGHSLGGAAVLAAAGDMKSVRAVATIGAPFDPAHVTRHFSDKIDRICREGEAKVDLGGRPFTISREFIDDISSRNLARAIETLGRALLVLHAPRDAVVGIDNAADIFKAAKHPKSFVTLDDADHLISDASDAEYAAGVIAAWATRYLGLKHPAPPPGAPEGITRVSESDPGGFLQDITSGPRHHVLADEPESYGGTNRGMSPYGFLASGLGACTSMTIRMYARRKGWPLDHVQVDVCHDKVHAQDAGSAGKSEKIDSFRREITLTGDLSEDQRRRLLEIADKCPVHRTLERSSQIFTTLTDSA
ncbi:bifunctional alpha/beta hydrolase/OsmC family protein [Aquicoccus porphyridii]|uniref:OsmC family protein n=1 Tax=Aquicoccus porphyridii TaxID=1852029 RepID=A0A5A9ZTG3_9RHOB|nr:bifunctional alpha/beta hydrolase/OsmC family protein [Aquicoccus porphyridii]KAA0920658.1 OsmC family protein [Aquicoccus porphyridii]RAI56788.1 osmotically inducible protein C [Rhodobacteraceae bacterium AsT-22]